MGICERIDKVTSIPEEYRGTALPAPISVKIELTGLCNFRCSFCHTSMNLREKKHMDFEVYKRLVDEMLDAGVEEIGLFFLGESFLYPKLAEAIKYAKDRGCKYTFLTTNGSLSSKDKVRECMKAGLDSLKWSFNYCDEEELHKVANVKKSYFNKIIENIQDAWSVRSAGEYECGLYASYIDFQGDKGRLMMEALNKIKWFVDEIYALPLYTHADILTEKEKAMGWKPTAGNRGRLGALRDGLPCWSVLSEGHISWDAKLSACCFSGHGDFIMADLNEVSFMDGWNSQAFQNLREHHLKKDVTGTPCESCVAYL